MGVTLLSETLSFILGAIYAARAIVSKGRCSSPPPKLYRLRTREAGGASGWELKHSVEPEGLVPGVAKQHTAGIDAN